MAAVPAVPSLGDASPAEPEAPLAEPEAPLAEPEAPLAEQAKPAAVRPPRAVQGDAPTYTRRELAVLPRLDRSYRALYTDALPDLDGPAPLVVGVSSAIRGEGRTTTALGLAMAVARDLERRVLLVELDLERPQLAGLLQSPPRPGVVEVLAGEVTLREAIQYLPAADLYLLPAGGPPPSVARVLRSGAFRELVQAVRSAYDLTVLDLPPTLASSEVGPISAHLDAVLLAVRAGVTPRRLVKQATEKFGEGKVRGLVLNGQESKIPRWLRKFF
jgi:Mrp family chromosome partitioning ATPase